MTDKHRSLLIRHPPEDLIEAVPYDAPNHAVACHPVTVQTFLEEGCRYDGDVASGGGTGGGERRSVRKRPRSSGTSRARRGGPRNHRCGRLWRGGGGGC